MLAIILLCTFMLGVKEPDPLAGLPTLDDFAWQMADDPKSAYRWSSKAFEALTPGTPISRKIRVASYFAQAADAVEEVDLLETHLQSIEGLRERANELNLTRDRTAIGKSLISYYEENGDLARSEALFKQTIDEARRSQDYEILSQMFALHGKELEGRGQKTLALQYVRDAHSMAANESLNISPLNRHIVRIWTALTLQRLGSSGFDQIIDDSMKYLMDRRPRHILAAFAYNVARELRHKDAIKALMYFDVTLREARSIDDKIGVSAALAEQAEIAWELGQYLEAERKASEAVTAIGSTNKFWLGRALLVKAQALWKLRKLSEALAVNDRALLLVSEQMTTLRSDIYKTQASIQEEAGLYKEAIQSQKEYQKIQAKIARDKEQENFAKARVELGLQMEEQKNLLLQKENELQAARLKTSRYLLIAAIALGILLLGAVASTVWALSNARKIQKAREKIQIILDVIEEGILTINWDLRPEPEYSRYLTRLYPGLFQREEDAIDWLFPLAMLGQERQSIIRETLRACLGEESLAWELNCGQLPSEIVLPGEIPRSIHILWQPLFNSEERIKGFLLSLRDISDQKRLQDEVLLQKEKSKALEQRVQELLLTRFQDARRLIDTLTAKLESPDELWLEAAYKRDLHTRKGEARTLGLKGLSEAIHSLESALSEGRVEAISQAISVLREETGAYQSLMRDMFMSRSTTEQSATSLMDVVGPLLPALRKQLKEGGIPVQSIDVSDGVDEWSTDVLDAVRQSLLHALSNSADHGYILPSRRGQRLYPAVLRVEADTDPSGKIQVRVRDFGAGLNMEKLKSMAEEKGFKPGPEETVADVVFLDGATTAETASATSGRGVGLSAVRQLCRGLNGDAHLLANDQGEGSLLVLSFIGASEHLKNSA
ncbi:MAG TPA: ATP-binding protein [Oligoflexus sp.]|uniref:ATP-binding protein n=1 Tax=Oligoflexus sp. TaxID=1971216 RepID=UPI002D487F57|nr:ATP-binding protein [Oligoflexus sp.]HYX32206.1 ATP-binding protein [Oligoflexus sp.]